MNRGVMQRASQAAVRVAVSASVAMVPLLRPSSRSSRDGPDLSNPTSAMSEPEPLVSVPARVTLATTGPVPAKLW